MRNHPALVFVARACIVLALPAMAETEGVAKETEMFLFENEFLRFSLDPKGHTLEFGGTRETTNYVRPQSPFCRVSVGGQDFPVSSLGRQGENLEAVFEGTDAKAVLHIESRDRYSVITVVGFEGIGVDSFTFLDVPLTLNGSGDERFVACAMALNLKTNVHEIPGPNRRLRALCYPRFGFEGARAAIIGCPVATLRAVMKDVVEGADEIPVNRLGGPFALDAEGTRGSYLMDTRASVTEETVEDWIRLAQELGVRQLDFHAGKCLRFGDYEPHREMYPRGLESVRAVTDRLKEAGILSGLHTYAFFIAKNARWVSPLPHADLAKDATFTLTEDLAAASETVPVAESTEKMSTDTGFFIPNSVVLQIEDELILYRGVSKEPPYAFTQCERGAHGTKTSDHAEGSKVYHLKEMFGLFAPEPDSELFDLVIERTAKVYNEGGFNMVYLDALDGAYVLAGPENAWHYGSKFVFELMRRLERPPLMEMSTFHHHLWYARSRVGAWDFPKRGYKRFVDMHTLANRYSGRIFLPSHLGWWGMWNWSGQDYDRMFPEDIEYICGKALAWDSGLSWIHGFDKDSYFKSLYLQRLGRIIRDYENLRLSRSVPEEILERLREPGKEFTLECDPDGLWKFRPTLCVTQRVMGSPEVRNLTFNNPFEPQPIRFRIEAGLSVANYEDPESSVLLDFSDPALFSEKKTRDGVGEIDLRALEDGSGVLSTTGGFQPRDGAWSMIGRPLVPPGRLDGRGIGVWVEGDGKGEIINLQPRGRKEFHGGYLDHYIVLDFTGPRYFEFVEPETERLPQFDWPYCPRKTDWESLGTGLLPYAYPAYFFPLDRKKVESFNIWFNNLPPETPVSCGLGPIKTLPLKHVALLDPAVTVNGARIVFPGELKSGEYIEYDGSEECTVCNHEGSPVRSLKPEGETPQLGTGENKIEFECGIKEDVRPRATITIFSLGSPL